MLSFTQALLRAAGFDYDHIEETWVVPVPLRPVVTVECDESGAYIMESLLEFHDILEANGCTYNNVAISGRYISIVGLSLADVAAMA